MNHFSELNLAKGLHAAISGLNFTTPTPIQAQAIPLALEGRDILACAQTGSGKTAAFSIPMLSTLMQSKESTALVLVPTRELAVQVTEVIRDLSLHAPLIRTVNLIGGVSMQPQLRALSKGYRIIVATPGRLVDHLERKSVNLNQLAILTLDEADRMLDMGFAPQLRQIFRYLPENYQTLLFSATLPENIMSLTQGILTHPAQVKIAETKTAAPKIEQKTRNVSHQEKNDVLLDEINARMGSILIFVRTQRRTDRLARFLEGYGLPVARIHGGRSQGQRNRALQDFKSEATRILCATDIAARGIDIDHVAHVINYDLPEVSEDYVHRIGRTARAGRTGEALALISPEEQHLWKSIEKLLKQRGTPSQASGKTLAQTLPHRPAAPRALEEEERSPFPPRLQSPRGHGPKKPSAFGFATKNRDARPSFSRDASPKKATPMKLRFKERTAPQKPSFQA